MRILAGAAVPPDPDSGAAGTIWQMNRALERMGHTVVELWDRDLGRTLRHGNLYYTFELPRRYRNAVAKCCRGSDFDVVELNQPHAFLAFEHLQQSGNDAVLVNRSHGVEVRADITLRRLAYGQTAPQRRRLRHSLSWLLQRRIWHHWDRIVACVDGVIVSSTDDRDFLASRYKMAPERIGLIAQGVPSLHLGTSPPPLDSQRLQRILHVGQVNPCKGTDLMIRLLVRLLSENPTLSFNWVCPKSEHARLIQQFPNELRDRVTMTDWMSQAALVEHLDLHGIFLFPSDFEGFGKAPLEAMARGLCVVASRVGGMRDCITHGKNGLLIEARNEEGFLNSIRWLVSQPAEAARISTAARQTASEYTWDRFAREATHFYESLRSTSPSNATATSIPSED